MPALKPSALLTPSASLKPGELTYLDAVLDSSPLRYWPLNETSGATATDLIASEVAVATGLTMGGAVAPAGIGGVAPLFTGTEHIALRSGRLLGGLAAWTIEAWVFYGDTTSTVRTFYGEMGASGNDQIQARMGNGSSTELGHVYGDDAALTTILAPVVYILGSWVHLVFTRSGVNAQMFWNAGRRTLSAGAQPGSAWTNAGVAAWLGMTPRSTNPFVGRIAHAAFYGRELPQSEILTHYEAGTPLKRSLPTRAWWKPNKAVWNQRLDDPLNPPTIASNSASVAANLAAQAAAFSPGTSAGGGPIYTVDSSTPKQRVRLKGGQNNFSLNHPDLYNAFGNVPIPVGGIVTGVVATDSEVQIYNSDSDELFEFWGMQQTLIEPEFVTATPVAGGSIAPNASPYYYVVYPADASGHIGKGTSAGATVTAGSQRVVVTWGTSESAVTYQVYRRIGSAGSGGNFMAEVPATTHSWTDDGSVTPGVPSSGIAAAVTTDWGARYGGYIGGTDDSTGVYEPPHQNWGASATSLPLWAGTVTLAEAKAAVTDIDAIQHAIAGALVQVVPSSHVYPAQRNDGSGGTWAIQEGTRFQLDPSFDITTIPNPFARSWAKALQVYGLIIRDVSGATTAAYIEDSSGLGRDPYPYAFGGKWNYEVLTGLSAVWANMRVIDPAWTLAQTLPPPNPLSSLTDDFSGSGSTPDPAVWASSLNAARSGGQMRLTAVGSTYANLVSIGGGGAVTPLTLLGSAVIAHVIQAAVGGGNQSTMKVASQIDTAHCAVWLMVDGTLLKAQYMNSGWATQTVHSETYNPAVHKWWKISESGGVVTFETSSDGLTWAGYASFSWSTSGWSTANLANVIARFSFGNSNGTAGQPDLVIDDFNLRPSAPPVVLSELPGLTVRLTYPGGVEDEALVGVTVGVG